MNNPSDAHEDDLLELFEDFEQHQQPHQQQQQQHQLEISSSSMSGISGFSLALAEAQDDEDGEEGTIGYEDFSRAAGGYMEEADHLLSYHSSSSAADVEVDVELPELSNATALDCGNFVDYDEFNLCLNNILSEEDDETGATSGGIAAKDHQAWRETDEVLNIVQLNTDLGLSFQDEQRSGSSSSPQLV